MKELGITRGEWRIDTADAIKIKAEDGSNIAILTHLTNFKRRDTDEVERNALLIADAGNTAQKCGLLPSELLQQRDRCLMTLSNCRETIEMLQREIPGEQIVLRHEMASRLNDIEAAIKTIER